MQRIRETFRKTTGHKKKCDNNNRTGHEEERRGSSSVPLSPKLPNSPTASASTSFSSALQVQRVDLEQRREQLHIPLTTEIDAKQRATSFNDIRPIKQVISQDSVSEDVSPCPSPSLEVPGASNAANSRVRSKSFDAATAAQQLESRPRRRGPSSSLLEIPKWRMFIRRSSAGSGSGSAAASPTYEQCFKDCVHCVLLDDFNKVRTVSPSHSVKSSVSSVSDCEDSEPDYLVTRSGSVSTESVDDAEDSQNCSHIRPIPVVTLITAPELSSDEEYVEDLGNGITVISLEVPVLPKSGRSASVDSGYLTVLNRPDIILCQLPANRTIRSHSVDISMPIGTNGPYLVVPNEKPVPVTTQYVSSFSSCSFMLSVYKFMNYMLTTVLQQEWR